MLYAKIFTDYTSTKTTDCQIQQNKTSGSNPINTIMTPMKKPALASASLLTPQSLFCFALGASDSEDLLAKRRQT